MKTRMIAAVAPLLSLLLGGCAHLDPTRVEADFGSSTRALVAGQYFDPESSTSPSLNPPTGVDGPKAEKILAAYRDDVSDRNFEDTQQAITVLTAQ